MNETQRQAVVQRLWPTGGRESVWAVLDCARDPRIYVALIESRLEFRCLYSGRLPRALEMVAPHLVEMLPTNRLTGRWLDEGWGRAWGMFMQVADAADLRHHLRKFLKVQDEHGRRLLFRYYDPRVLRAYLPTCRVDELGQVFGPVSRYFTESEDALALLGWRFDGTRLVAE